MTVRACEDDSGDGHAMMAMVAPGSYDRFHDDIGG